MTNLQDEMTYKLLKLIEDKPQLSQRKIAKHMGVSLGKVNYCIKALVDRGLLKGRDFYKHKSKKEYFYLLTPKGVEEKTLVTYRFLKRKLAEYERIKVEIKRLKGEAAILDSSLKSKSTETEM